MSLFLFWRGGRWLWDVQKTVNLEKLFPYAGCIFGGINLSFREYSSVAKLV